MTFSSNISDLASRIATELNSISGDITDHIDDTTDAHEASAIGYTDSVGIGSSHVQGAITNTFNYAVNVAGTRVAKTGDTMSGVLAMGGNKITGLAVATADTDAVNKSQASSLALAAADLVQDNLYDHISDVSGAHDASAIGYSDGLGLGETDVQDAIDALVTRTDTLDTDLDAKANRSGDTFTGQVRIEDEAAELLLHTTDVGATADKSKWVLRVEDPDFSEGFYIAEVNDAENSFVNRMGFPASGGAWVGGGFAVYDDDLDVDSNKIVNVADGTATNDAVNLGQLNTVAAQLANYVSKSGDTMTGRLDIARPSAAGDEAIRLNGGGSDGTDPNTSPYISFYGGTDANRAGYIGYPSVTDDAFQLRAEKGPLVLSSATDYVSISEFAPWTNVTFQNSWGNYGSPFQECQYRKIGDIVYVRGLVQRTGGHTTAHTIFTLPSGYRPASGGYTMYSQWASGTFSGVGGQAARRINVYSNGAVTPNEASTTTSWFYLDFQFSTI